VGDCLERGSAQREGGERERVLRGEEDGGVCVCVYRIMIPQEILFVKCL
jgi:hypothetical protein